jgi:ElaB/YqjD/DUF883 family membrane-anchored ribosome-binding protein
MMNGKTLEKRINRDLDRAKRDLAALGDDLVVGLSRNFEQLSDGPRKSAAFAVKNLNKSIGQGLNQYNTKIQDVVDRVPGDIGKKAAGYPWVAITMSMVLGLVLGTLLKLGRTTYN